MITSIEEVMTQSLLTVPAGKPLSAALALMKEKRIRHLPVVDERNQIVGVLLEKDAVDATGPESIPVDRVMSVPVDFVDAQLPLRQAILHMLGKKITCLLVVNDKKEVTGIVTTDDLLWHLAHLLSSEKEDRPVLGPSERLTIGEIANELSLMGI